MAELIGKQLGNYRLIRRLGHGGFGDVYLGQHVHLQRHAAIKVLHAHMMQWGEEAFRAEAQRLVDLEHPHIVRIFDFGIEAGISYLVMEYAPNGSLRERHPSGSHLPLDTIVLYVKHLADALQYLHERKLIHRDIKPANILLGSKNNLLLSDVGLAIVSHSADSVSLQQIAGTPAYMAPEQAQGMAIQASDQYSLGVMVYEWLCCELPFTRSNKDGKGVQKEMEEQHRSTPPPPLRGKIPTISPLLETVVLTALSKDPKSRFVNVQAFANALEQASQSELFTSLASQVTAFPSDQSSLSKVLAPGSAWSSIPSDPVVVTSSSQSSLPKDVITPPNQLTHSNKLVERPVVSFAGSNTLPTQRAEEIASPIMTQGNPRRKARPRRKLTIVLLLFTLLLIAGGIGYAFLESNLFLKRPVVASQVTTPASQVATITITPASKDLKNSYTISGVTGTPDKTQHQIQARRISASTQPQAQTVNATGTGTTPGTQAGGTLTFYNYSSNTDLTFNAGSTFSNIKAPAIVMILDTSVTLPATTGGPTSAIVHAHVVQRGTIGNIGITAFVYDGPIDPNTNRPTWEIENDSAFSGGSDDQKYMVVQQSDIDSAASSLEATNTPNAQQVLQPQIHANEQLVGSPQCNPMVTSNHSVGETATNLIVTVVFTCAAEVYDQQGALAAGEQWLKQDAIQSPGAGYMLIGNVVTNQTQARVSDTSQNTISISITAEGVWVYQFNDAQKHALAKLVAGKKKGIVQSLLLQQQGFARIDIQLPSDDNDTLPTDLSQIKLIVLSVRGMSP
jgi:serine/threonine protein kinase